MSGGHEINYRAPMYRAEKDEVADLPLGLYGLLADIELESARADWSGGEVYQNGAKPKYSKVRFSWIDHGLGREFDVEGHWEYVKRVDFDCLVVDRIVEKVGNGKTLFERRPG